MGIYSKEDGILIYVDLISIPQRLRRNIISLSMKDLWNGKMLARSSEEVQNKFTRSSEVDVGKHWRGRPKNDKEPEPQTYVMSFTPNSILLLV